MQQKRNFIESYIQNVTEQIINILYCQIDHLEKHVVEPMDSVAHHAYVTGHPISIIINLSHFIKQNQLPLQQQFEGTVANIQLFNAQTMNYITPEDTCLSQTPFKDFFVDVKYINLAKVVRTVRINLSANPGWSGVCIKPHGFTLFPNGDDRRIPLNDWTDLTMVPLDSFTDRPSLIGRLVMYTGVYIPLHSITGKIIGILDYDRVAILLETVRIGNEQPVTQKIIADGKDLRVILKLLRDDTNPAMFHRVPRTEF
jgi:hypothetical protein